MCNFLLSRNAFCANSQGALISDQSRFTGVVKGYEMCTKCTPCMPMPDRNMCSIYEQCVWQYVERRREKSLVSIAVARLDLFFLVCHAVSCHRKSGTSMESGHRESQEAVWGWGGWMTVFIIWVSIQCCRTSTVPFKIEW